MTFADITQLGIGGASLWLLWLVWGELKSQNEFNREMLRSAQKERKQLLDDMFSLKMRMPKNEDRER